MDTPFDIDAQVDASGECIFATVMDRAVWNSGNRCSAIDCAHVSLCFAAPVRRLVTSLAVGCAVRIGKCPDDLITLTGKLLE